MNVVIHTDGACKGNPGRGGWGAIIIMDKEEVILSGSNNSTTNNQMELLAMSNALEYITNKIVSNGLKPKTLKLYSDSKYVVEGSNKWMFKWSKNNWTLSSGAVVKNVEIWLSLFKNIIILKKRKVKYSISWVKGHNGDELNERVDKIASSSCN